MDSLRLLTSVAVVMTLVNFSTQISPFTEECVYGHYPPAEKSKIPKYTINLDDPPLQRWSQVAKDKGAELRNLLKVMKDFLAQWSTVMEKTVMGLVDRDLAPMVDTLPYPFADEIKGMAQYSGAQLGEVLLYNIFYEVFSMCTSIVAEDPSGKLYHARNLDFGLLMGWEPKKHSWMVTDALRPMIIELDFQRQGKTVFKSVNFAGYVGILTAIKPSIFTLSMDERFALNGGYVGIIEWFFGMRSSQWMGFLTRDVMENATSYAMAKGMLTNSSLLSPAYFILGGNQSGQACVITRARNKALDVWDLGTRNSTWYILETNYDNWKKPLFIDNRRTPAHQCLDEKTQKNASFSGLFDVLSSRPMLNKLTTYTSLMRVDTGTLETYIRHCPDPCPPF